MTEKKYKRKEMQQFKIFNVMFITGSQLHARTPTQVPSMSHWSNDWSETPFSIRLSIDFVRRNNNDLCGSLLCQSLPPGIVFAACQRCTCPMVSDEMSMARAASAISLARAGSNRMTCASVTAAYAERVKTHPGNICWRWAFPATLSASVSMDGVSACGSTTSTYWSMLRKEREKKTS